MTFSKFVSLAVVACAIFNSNSNAAVDIEFCDNHKCNITCDDKATKTFDIIGNDGVAGNNIPGLLDGITDEYFRIQNINYGVAMDNINFNCVPVANNKPCMLTLRNSQTTNNSFPDMTFNGGNNVFKKIIAIRFGKVQFNELKSVEEIAKYGKNNFIAQKFNEAIEINNNITFPK